MDDDFIKFAKRLYRDELSDGYKGDFSSWLKTHQSMAEEEYEEAKKRQVYSDFASKYIDDLLDGDPDFFESYDPD